MPQESKAATHYGMNAFVDYPKLSPARHRQSLRRAEAEAVKIGGRGIPEIRELVGKALLSTQRAYELRRRWKTEQAAVMHRPDARIVDRVLDAAVTGMHGILVNNLDLFPEGHAKHVAAKGLLSLFFPNGLPDVIQATFVEEQAAVDDIVSLARDESGDWTEPVVTLGLQDALTRIAEINVEYDKVITRPSDILAFAAVRTAEQSSYDLTLGVVALICGTFCEEPEKRQQLLTPFVDQRREAQLYRDRRANGAAPFADEDDDFDDEASAEGAARPEGGAEGAAQAEGAAKAEGAAQDTTDPSGGPTAGDPQKPA
jgi:hypothetical protein